MMEEACDSSGKVKTDFIVHPDGSITADEITVPAASAPALSVEATKERLVIRELNVRNFKSYAGSRTIGPFDKNFSCIVGPNGSGKSNVIDALLFVFGYRAQKIRSKKVSVLIHKSEKYPDLDSCSVTVNFATIKDEGENFTILPGSKFNVTRTGYKDNSSTYEINGRRAQYKEVTNLLRNYGVDLDFNRFMVLQGEIELISMMKPKGLTDQETGMLEYIEDIIGTSHFINAIQHFHTKLEEANEKRIDPENVPRLFDLISVKDKNVLPAFYYALRNTLVANDLDQATRVGLKGSTRHRVVTLKGELIDLSGTMSGGGGGRCFKGRMGQSVSDNSFSQEEIDKLAEDTENLANELAELKHSKLKLKEMNEVNKKELASLQHSVKMYKHNYEDFKAAAPDQEEISEIQQKIDQHQKNYTTATNEVAVVENKAKDLQEKIMAITKGKYGTAQKKIDKVIKEIDQASQNITKNKTALKNTEKNLKKSEDKIESLKAELESCQKAMEAFKEEFKNLESRGLEVSNKKKEAEDALMLCQVQKAAVSGEIKGLSSKVNEIKSEMIEYKNKLKLLDVEIRSKQSQLKTLKNQLSKLELNNVEEGPTELPDLTEKEINKISINSLSCSIAALGQEYFLKLMDALMLCQVQKAAVSGEIKGLSSKVNEIKSEMIEYKNKLKLLDVEIRSKQSQLKTLKNQLSKLELNNVEEGPTELPDLTEKEINKISINSLHYEIGEIQNQIKGTNPDLGAIAEFKRKEEICKMKLQDLEEIVLERDHYRNHYENFRKHRLEEFMRGFNIITLKVKELYQMLTLGGDAELELVDSIDPFSEGIEFSVRPLRKSWKSIRNLSGGEKTLSSLSLVFALHYYRSTPFFVMDEIDAALDFRSVSIIGSYIKDCTKNAQFFVISLRENMFMLADHLIGIYKTNNCTKDVHFHPPPEETIANRERAENADFDKLRTIKPIPYHYESSKELSETSLKKTDDSQNELVDYSSKETLVEQGNVITKKISIPSDDTKDKEINRSKTETSLIENVSKIDKENLSRSTRSNLSKLQTPKRENC
ncbi:structural maintenance of chromosomes protein 4-like [Argiope bruennichi]|uniref:structural maintenance of chromosomes protein 4-like n=1 Tax=Argiope bruennichi TaxID=94029 RepID=UPI002494A627|nr:structural maintenance of chromosomes protein 4-like [Argiope bruennichi]